MRARSWPVLSIAFGSLLFLISVLGLGAFRQARNLSREIELHQQSYRAADLLLDRVRTQIYHSGLLVRDYLLDQSHLSGPLYKQELVSLRDAMGSEINEIEALLGGDDRAQVRNLREELDAYWNTLDPVFDWTPQQKIATSAIFLRQIVLPRREAVLNMARDLRVWNEARLKRQQEQVRAAQRQFEKDLWWILSVSLALGLVVAVVSVMRIARLEGQADLGRERAEEAEGQMRRLSQQLVEAQEEERKALSRELHDEVGQMLTALRIEMGNLERLRSSPAEVFHQRAADLKRLTEEALRAVRNLAMGLRPAMLDDLGLGPAVEWHAREYSRRCGVPVNVEISGALDALPEKHRTSVYRVIQEALTNCARHSKATHIRIALHAGADGLALAIEDDGVGFDPGSRRQGIGLTGIEERVRDLNGHFELVSAPGKGTALRARIPLEEAVLK